MNRIASLVHRYTRHERLLVLRATTRLSTRVFSAEVGIIDLNTPLQTIVFFTLTHGPDDFAVNQPCGIPTDTQMATEL